MNDIRQSIKPSVLFWGLLLIGIGTVLLLDRLGIADLRSVNRTWWPLIMRARNGHRGASARRCHRQASCRRGNRARRNNGGIP